MKIIYHYILYFDTRYKYYQKFIATIIYHYINIIIKMTWKIHYENQNAQ